MKDRFHFRQAILLFFCLNAWVLAAQSPQKMSYQSVIRDADDKLVAEQLVGIRISLLQGSPGGTEVYAETHLISTNANGLATLQIGSGNVVSGAMDEINWGDGPFYIRTSTDPDGGTDYTITGTSELLSVPYALYAANGGVEGPQGPQGIAGPQGPKGDTGETGDRGPEGVKGDKGDKGEKGDKGDIGLQGPMGVPGPSGGENQQVIFNDNDEGDGDPEFLFDKTSNHIAVGATSINPNAALEIKSVSGALLLPRMTTQQRNAIDGSEGMLIYNTDIQKFQGFVGDSGTITIAMSEVSAATYFVGDDGVNIDYVAQTFTPFFQGLLQTFEFNVSSLSPGFQLTVELYEGDTPGIGFYMIGQVVNVNSLGWITVNYPPTFLLHEGTTYHFILKPAVVSGNFIGVLRSNGDPVGEHDGGTLFSFNSATGTFNPSLLDDLDFRVKALVNNQGWVNLH